MKMVIAIVSQENAPAVIQHLSAKGFGITAHTSHGGFLGRESATLMIVAADERIGEITSIIRANTRRQEVFVSDKAADNAMLSMRGEGMVTISGATVFVLNVEQVLKV